VSGEHIAGNLIEVGGGASRLGVLDDGAQRFGHDGARGGHRLDLGFGLQLDHSGALLANGEIGPGIYAIPAVPLYIKPVNVNLMGGFEWLAPR
jgi:hypothetical protein